MQDIDMQWIEGMKENILRFSIQFHMFLQIIDQNDEIRRVSRCKMATYTYS